MRDVQAHEAGRMHVRKERASRHQRVISAQVMPCAQRRM
jgi:hypothetical protein